MSSKVLIVGGDRSGEYISWFGHRVNINRKHYVLHRAYFTDGSNREYYVLDGMALLPSLHSDTVQRVEVCG